MLAILFIRVASQKLRLVNLNTRVYSRIKYGKFPVYNKNAIFVYLLL